MMMSMSMSEKIVDRGYWSLTAVRQAAAQYPLSTIFSDMDMDIIMAREDTVIMIMIITMIIITITPPTFRLCSRSLVARVVTTRPVSSVTRVLTMKESVPSSSSISSFW